MKKKDKVFVILTRVIKAGLIEEGREGIMEQRNSKRKGPEVDACLSQGRRLVRLKWSK